jgi:hypothetical protein
MRHTVTGICAVALTLIFTGLVTISVAAAPTSHGDIITTMADGISVINPCALAGTGEAVLLTGGTVVLTYDRWDRLIRVHYRDVQGIGLVSSTVYAVTYEETHRYQGPHERFSSRLTVTGGGTSFREEYTGRTDQLAQTSSCV